MSDTQKIVNFITTALTPHLGTQVPFVFVHEQTAFQSCKFTSLRKKAFREEVGDALTFINTVRDVGTWLYTEFGDGFGVFVRVLNADESKNLVGSAAIINALNRKTVNVNGQGIGVGLAFGMDRVLHERLKEDDADDSDLSY